MPLQRVIENSPQHKIAIWQIEEDVAQLAAALDVSERDREVLDGFRLDKRKKEWLAARLLLKTLLGFYPELSYDGNGKPALSNGAAFISISHTDGFAAVSVSDKPTAIDIELCQRRVEKVAKRFVHVDEEAYLGADNRIQYLTILWSAKEALYKYYNIYGVIFKEQFKVYPFVLENDGFLSCDFMHQDETDSLKLSYTVNEDYTLVYC